MCNVLIACGDLGTVDCNLLFLLLVRNIEYLSELFKKVLLLRAVLDLLIF